MLFLNVIINFAFGNIQNVTKLVPRIKYFKIKIIFLIIFSFSSLNIHFLRAT